MRFSGLKLLILITAILTIYIQVPALAALDEILTVDQAVRLRSEPSGKVVGGLYKGELVKAASGYGDWVRVYSYEAVNADGQTALGYAASRLLRKATPRDIETAKVVARFNKAKAAPETAPAQPAAPAKIKPPQNIVKASLPPAKQPAKARPAATAAPAVTKAAKPPAKPAGPEPAPAAELEKPKAPVRQDPENPNAKQAVADKADIKQALIEKYTKKGVVLAEAVSFALNYNLDAAAAKQEREILIEEQSAKMMAMLPSLIVQAERSWKDRDLPVASVNAKTGELSLAPSISSEQETRTEGVELSFDVLNFATSYLEYQRAGYDLKASEAHIERIKQNLALDVTRAYMNAAGAKSVLSMCRNLWEEAREARVTIHAQMNKKLVSEVEGLESDVNLIKIMLMIEEYTREYEQAMTRLAHIMGWQNPAGLKLRDYDFSSIPKQEALPVQDLIKKALSARPEMRKLEMEHKSAQGEQDLAFYESLPSLKIYGRFDHDDNMYMTEHEWYTFGLNLSWDLLSIPGKVHMGRAAERKGHKVALQKKAMKLAVTTQVRLAVLEQKNLFRRFGLLKDLDEARMRLLKALEAMVKKGKTSQSILLDAAHDYLNAHVRYVNTHSRIVVSRARLANAVGDIVVK